MHSHKDMNVNNFRIPTTQHFFKGEGVKLRGKLCSLLMVYAEKCGAKIKKWGRCQLAIA